MSTPQTKSQKIPKGKSFLWVESVWTKGTCTRSQFRSLIIPKRGTIEATPGKVASMEWRNPSLVAITTVLASEGLSACERIQIMFLVNRYCL